jgi:NitT/TauT family transport system permease protein
VLPILVNTIAGVRNIDPDLLKAARILRPGQADFRDGGHTVLGAIHTDWCASGVAHGLIGAIIGELFAGSEGIGYMISYAGQMFQTDTLLVGVIVVAAVGMLLTSAGERVRRHFQRWRPEHVGGR